MSLQDSYAVVKAQTVRMRGHRVFTEQWLQDQIADDPTLLGLGDVVLRDRERRQPQAGRLDLLLSDPEAQTRYEVEIQLGATDESHIIRTIEYWDIERRRYPNYDHVAVIVAEDVTSRFLNVISLFNGFIPLIAIQLRVLALGDQYTIVATRVVDLMPLGTDEEDEAGAPTDRHYWETQRASSETLRLADRFLELIQRSDPGVEFKYNKFYIGLARSGSPDNYVVLRPRKRAYVLVDMRVPRSDELDARIEDAGIEMGTYTRWGQYRLRISESDLTENADLLTELIDFARDPDRE